ncbi:MAG: cytochrome P450, partial [Gammaproteobacteria bacterium]
PAQFLMRAWQECGELAEFDQGGILTVLMVGPEAQEAVFRAPDDQLSAALAYQYMVPIFGKGVQYGAPIEEERQQLRMHSQGLRAERMGFYAPIIAREAADWIRGWGDHGEMDFYEGFAELTIRTSTHCLLGPEFRYTLTEEFARLYHALGAAVDASGTVDHTAQKAAYARRDEARARLGDLIISRVALRRAGSEAHDDLLSVYMNSTLADGRHLSDEQIAGMVVWFMFAGHHTSANTAAWTLVELARHPAYCREIVAEIDALYADDPELGYRTLRKMPLMDGFVREILRAHPPLNALSRRVVQDFHYRGHVIEAGKNIMIAPYVSHRIPEFYPDPERFDPHRPEQPNPFAYIPFGGGPRKCVGNAFAILQVKRIFCELLRHYTFELAGPPETYAEIMPSLILRPSDPCVLRYRRRDIPA